MSHPTHTSTSTHSTNPTHPASHPTHSTNPTHTIGPNHSHKNTIEQFANAVNGNHLDNLDKYLDSNVQKTVDSKAVYNNLKEAHDYYTKEHTNNKSAQWKIIHTDDKNDEKGNTYQARLTYDNKTYNITYTFSSAGKIQRIDANQDTTNIPK
ncbi:unnamed protein product [Adineta steineri]|uniref:Uncharacterized protein n=1 Tax=Adineta steineri TaxID=433720 RepID=A0A819FH15_9BILA|nr:unnamed protein product [Adineta steineri]CAF3868697.1 unnamed protein product [Adineta steineri]